MSVPEGTLFVVVATIEAAVVVTLVGVTVVVSTAVDGEADTEEVAVVVTRTRVDGRVEVVSTAVNTETGTEEVLEPLLEATVAVVFGRAEVLELRL